MRYRLLVVACGLFLSTPAIAQKVDLLCDGKYSNFVTPSAPRDMAMAVVLRLDLSENVVDVLGGVEGMSGRHRINERSEYMIRFTTSQGYTGHVNRWDGVFGVVHRNDSRIQWMLTGTCKPAKPMF